MADGRLRVDGHLTKVGVFEYRNHDGSVRREYRPEHEVFKQDSLETFEGVVVTDDHPPEVINARNARAYAVGTVGEKVRRDGDHVVATMWVNDAATIEKMERGKVELSCGYECDLVAQPGEFKGQRYDAVQTNIRGNHVAIVDVGRAGPSARVRMDAAVMTSTRAPGATGDRMKDSEALAGALSQVTAQTLRADNAERERDSERKRADAATGEAESLRADLAKMKERTDALTEADPEGLRRKVSLLEEQLRQAQKARTDAESPARLREAVKARVALESSAQSVLGDKYNCDTMDDRSIMVAVVEKLHGTTLGTEKSLDYVRARFDTAIEGYAAGNAALAAVQATVNQNRQDTNPVKSAREAMIERNQKAWQSTATKGA